MQNVNRTAFLSSLAIIGVTWVIFTSGERKKAGHNLFDTQKPEAVAAMEEKRFEKGGR